MLVEHLKKSHTRVSDNNNSDINDPCKGGVMEGQLSWEDHSTASSTNKSKVEEKVDRKG